MEPKDALALEEIDLSSTAFWERPWDEREGAFRTLRRERPLAHFALPEWQRDAVEALGGHDDAVERGYWAATRMAEVAEISRHPELYRSGQGAVSLLDLPPEMVEYFAGMISTDNPRHARLRRIVSQAFNPRRVKSVEEAIEVVAGRILDEVAERDQCDFVLDVAAHLPLRIVCDMMGVPPSAYADVLRCANVILSDGDPEIVPADQDFFEVLLGAGAELTAMMEELAAHRLEHPADDLTTALINSNIDGESLTHAELASFFILLLTAGSETTRTALAHGLWALTEHPEQRRLWMADLDGITPSAVEEVVRWGSPVIWMRRTVAAETVLAGQPLAEGDKVLLFYNSANRDEDVFTDPFSFDVRRDPNPHVGFGAAGPHFCLGAHLARRELDVMFRQLLTRFPDIVAIGEPVRLRSSFINGIKHLPCALNPSGASSG